MKRTYVRAGAALMRAAGCAYNDVVDRDLDRKVARTAGRPVAAGTISVRRAWAFVIGCSLVSFLILLTLGPLAIGLGVMIPVRARQEQLTTVG